MRSWLVLPVLLLLAGCGGGDKSTKPVTPADGLPIGTPAADSPTHLMQRFEATWESQVGTEYARLLSGDFHFKFSAAADPNLVNLYGDNWSRTDEDTAMTHVFGGFTNTGGTVIPGASSIDLTLNGVSYGADFDHSDSTRHYQKVVSTAMDLTIEVPSAPYEPLVYHVISREEFYLVRGDAAVLPPGAIPDSTRWYLRRWDDLASPVLARKGPVINPASPSTLGKIKASYR